MCCVWLFSKHTQWANNKTSDPCGLLFLTLNWYNSFFHYSCLQPRYKAYVQVHPCVRLEAKVVMWRLAGKGARRVKFETCLLPVEEMAHWKAYLHGMPWSRDTVWCPFSLITDRDTLGAAGSCRWYFPECCWFPHYPVYQRLAALKAEVVPWCCKLTKAAVTMWCFCCCIRAVEVIAAFLFCFLKLFSPPPQRWSELVAAKCMIHSGTCQTLSLLILIDCHPCTELLSFSLCSA